MIDHFGVNCRDLPASAAFYDAVFGTLGHARLVDFGVAIGYGSDGTPQFWISGSLPEIDNREMHLAFSASGPDAVHAFHASALAAGAEELHAPRLWPEYHPGYFAAFVRDPDGNNVEAVTHHGG